MKKLYYIFLIMTLLMSGCEEHSQPLPEVDQPLDSYIFFDAGVVGTRGNLIEGDRLPSGDGVSFGVFGFREDGSEIFNMYKAGKNSSFDNVAVMYRPEVEAAFIYDALALWTKGKHSFYAYYPYDDPASDVLPHIMNLNGRPCLQYNQPMTLDTMIDVLTAAALNKTSSDTDAQPVQLTFEHRLFAFDVILNNTQSESARDLRILGASVKFANVCKTGYLYFDNTDDDEYADILPGTEVCDTIRHSFDIEEGLLTIPAPEGESTIVSHNFNETSSFLFLPCASLEVHFTLDFINAWNEECTFKTNSTIRIPSRTSFLPGHRYALVINKKDNGREIEFEASLELIYDNNGNHWDSSPEIDIEFN